MSRIDELAKPREYRVTEKYVPHKRVYPPISRPIVPFPNERLAELSEPRKDRKTDKYEAPTGPFCSVNQSALEALCSPRIEELATPFVLKLAATKQLNRFLGKPFEDKMNEKIIKSLNTSYNIKRKARFEARQEEAKVLKGKKAPKKIIWSADKNRLGTLNVPKKIKEEDPPPERKVKPLKYLKERLKTLAKGKKRLRYSYKSPEEKEFEKKQKRNLKGALEYEATKRILSLTRIPDHKQQEEECEDIFFTVKPAALRAELTSRLKELAVQKERLCYVCDYEEEPRPVSQNALRYEATTRIKELSIPKRCFAILEPVESDGKKQYGASARTKELAKPKRNFAIEDAQNTKKTDKKKKKKEKE